MQNFVIVILIISVLLAAQGYYCGYYRPTVIHAWLAQAGFFFMSFVLIPFLAVALWLQSGAQDRLVAIGFVPHPSIEEVAGIAVGYGKNPKWAFASNAKRDEIVNFYRDEKNRAGWKLINSSSMMLIFKKDNLEMDVGLSKGWLANTLIFSLEENIER